MNENHVKKKTFLATGKYLKGWQNILPEAYFFNLNFLHDRMNNKTLKRHKKLCIQNLEQFLLLFFFSPEVSPVCFFSADINNNPSVPDLFVCFYII